MLHAYFLSVKLSINNVSMEVGGEGWVSQMLTLTNKGGGWGAWDGQNWANVNNGQPLTAYFLRKKIICEDLLFKVLE